jgi:hypothetical protein
MVHDGASGNVIGYNNVTICHDDYGFLKGCLVAHGHWGHMNLYEGNIVGSGMVIFSDWWGPCPYNVFFKNTIIVSTTR